VVLFIYVAIEIFTLDNVVTKSASFIMVLSKSDKAIIEACVKEKGWNGNRIFSEFPARKWTRQSIYNLTRKIKKTGSTDRKSGSGRSKSVSTDENKDAVEELIQSQDNEPGTHRSQRQIAQDLSISRSSVQRIVKGLKLKAYKRIRTSHRDCNVRQRRKTRCKSLYDRLSTEDVRKIVFTDEKDFTLEVAKNTQNDRVYGFRKKEIDPSRLYHETSRFSKKVMVSAGISWEGKTQIHFINTKTAKVNSESYINLLNNGLLPDCRRLYPDEDYIFQQDGAPSHTSRLTQNHLEQNTPNFIKKNEWPPQSPDCNPMDYSIWDSLSQKVYSGRNTKFTETELKEKIIEAWDDILLNEVRHSISSWKKRLRVVCQQGGGHIDHLLK